MSAWDPWFRCYRPSPAARVRLVCFPHAGGSASAYIALARQLPPEIEALSVQYPGRQERRHEPLCTDLLDLADQIFAALRVLPGRRPVAFFGHSMGATLAYEVARRLEGETCPTLRTLFVSGRRAPSRVRPERMHLGEDDSDGCVVAELKALSGTNASLLEDEEMRRVILPIIRSDYAAIERYRRPDGLDLNCPIVILAGDSDPLTTIEEARAWADHTTAGAEVHVFRGGHFYLDAHGGEIGRIVIRHLIGPAEGC